MNTTDIKELFHKITFPDSVHLDVIETLYSDEDTLAMEVHFLKIVEQFAGSFGQLYFVYNSSLTDQSVTNKKKAIRVHPVEGLEWYSSTLQEFVDQFTTTSIFRITTSDQLSSVLSYLYSGYYSISY